MERKKSEKRVEQEIQLSLSKVKTITFRNAVGVGYTKDGSMFNYGLCKGSSDLIGITPVTITEDMVGKTIGVFTAIEIKKSRTGYKASDIQKRFIDMVNNNGGIAGVAYDTKSALDLVNKYK